MAERGSGADAAHHAFAPQVASTEGLGLMPFLLTSVTSGLEHPYYPPVNLGGIPLSFRLGCLIQAEICDSGVFLLPPHSLRLKLIPDTETSHPSPSSRCR